MERCCADTGQARSDRGVSLLWLEELVLLLLYRIERHRYLLDEESRPSADAQVLWVVLDLLLQHMIPLGCVGRWDACIGKACREIKTHDLRPRLII